MLITGRHTLAPDSDGYFWSPSSRVVTVPPDARGIDTVERHVQKQIEPAGPSRIAVGEALTYTVHLMRPVAGAPALYDAAPTFTTLIRHSLQA